MKNIFYNAHHSPIGSFSTFTLGYPGAKGGLGLELDKPVNKNVYIGIESVDKMCYEALPFFEGIEDDMKRYDLEQLSGGKISEKKFVEFDKDLINRDFNLCTDEWTVKDIKVSIYSQVQPIPDPSKTDKETLKSVLVPSIVLELVIDNTEFDNDRLAFIGFDGSDPYYSLRQISTEKINGITQGDMIAIVANNSEVSAAVGFSINTILNEKNRTNWKCRLGNTAAMIMNVKAGEKKTYNFGICFYHNGKVTKELEMEYFYTNLFKDIEEVGEYTLANVENYKKFCKEMNIKLISDKLSDEQKFMLSHSIRSYYGSTELLEKDGKPFWIVNEGEYRMMNTLDLTVDQLFYEIKMNPWTVKNVLDFFVDRYSYYDNVCCPGEKKEYSGGLTFTHDMGIANIFSNSHYSVYERAGLEGCFSYMSHEQLVNWLCCALVYIENSNDKEWTNDNIDTIKECFYSMLNRDNPDPTKRNGIMGFDSSRCQGGSEITTYDSLDLSLGQARNNIYIAGKCWAVYVSLEKLFKDCGENNLSKHAANQAKICSDTIVSNITEDGYIPAIINEDNDSKIIPAIEGLIFPYFSGCKEALNPEGEYGNYIKTLKKHFKTILVNGVCLFRDNGWKLSSTSNNSWLSKIYLNQFIARKILGFNNEKCKELADEAHVKWLTHPKHSYWCWSDQIISGIITGSKYYPRGVTSILWTYE